MLFEGMSLFAGTLKRCTETPLVLYVSLAVDQGGLLLVPGNPGSALKRSVSFTESLAVSCGGPVMVLVTFGWNYNQKTVKN